MLYYPSGARTRRAHTSTQTTDARYKCQICHLRFNNSGNYSRHTKEQHSGPNTELAEFCCPDTTCKRSAAGKGFGRKHDADRHFNEIHLKNGNTDTAGSSK